MAQTRPNTTTDGGKALAREITGLKRRVRDLELRPDPAPTGGGGSGAWAELRPSGWIDGSSFSCQAVSNLGASGIYDQSGGFAVLDDQTISLPEGIYLVQWAFTFSFLLQNPWSGYMAAGDFGRDWALWRAGPCAVTNGVEEGTLLALHGPDPVHLDDYGGGDGALVSGKSGSPGWFVWQRVIRALSPNKLNLSLGLVDLNELFSAVPDFDTATFTAFIQDPALGSGDHLVRIQSMGS